MNNFYNSGMGMGMGEGMLGGGSHGGRYSMDEFQQSAGMGHGSMGANSMSLGGTSAMGGMGTVVGYPRGGGIGGYTGVGGIGNNNVLPQAGREDELLLNILRERNQLQGSSGVSGGVSGVMPGLYNNTSQAGMPQSSLLGNLNSGGVGPFDFSSLDQQGAGLGLPPSHRSKDLMMRDFSSGGAVIAGNRLYEHQHRSNGQAGSGSGLGLSLSGIDPSGFDPQAAQKQRAHQQQRQNNADEGKKGELGEEERWNAEDAGGSFGRQTLRGPIPGGAEAISHDSEESPLFKNNDMKSSKKGRSKDAPRRPLSAYNLFFSEERERILKEREQEAADDPGKPKAKMQVQEMAKIIGERWRVISDEQRKHYQALADEDMKRHKEAKKRNPKDPNVPKRPPTAFLLFSNKRRKALKRQYPDATNSDLSKMLSKTWREAPEEIRQKYMEEATELSKVYKADMVVWRKKAGDRRAGNDFESDAPIPLENRAAGAMKKSDYDDLPDFALGVGGENRSSFLMDEEDEDMHVDGDSKPGAAGKQSAKKRKIKDPSAPKRPLSAFLAFSNARRKAVKQQNPDATNADLSKMLSKMWREAPVDFRQEFIDEAAGRSEAYKSRMAEWRLKAAV